MAHKIPAHDQHSQVPPSGTGEKEEPRFGMEAVLSDDDDSLGPALSASAAAAPPPPSNKHVRKQNTTDFFRRLDPLLRQTIEAGGAAGAKAEQQLMDRRQYAMKEKERLLRQAIWGLIEKIPRPQAPAGQDQATFDKMLEAELDHLVEARVKSKLEEAELTEKLGTVTPADYALLGAKSGESRESVAKKVRDLSFQLHPDRNQGETDAAKQAREKKWQDIQDAYQRIGKHFDEEDEQKARDEAVIAGHQFIPFDQKQDRRAIKELYSRYQHSQVAPPVPAGPPVTAAHPQPVVSAHVDPNSSGGAAPGNTVRPSAFTVSRTREASAGIHRDPANAGGAAAAPPPPDSRKP